MWSHPRPRTPPLPLAQEVELAELQAVNPTLTSTASIYVGQRLFLPPYDSTCPSDPLASLPPCRNVTVKVRRGC